MGKDVRLIGTNFFMDLPEMLIEIKSVFVPGSTYGTREYRNFPTFVFLMSS